MLASVPVSVMLETVTPFAVPTFLSANVPVKGVLKFTASAFKIPTKVALLNVAVVVASYTLLFALKLVIDKLAGVMFAVKLAGVIRV